MSCYRSGLATQLDAFVRFRKASGAWNEHASGENLRYFDRYCAEQHPDSTVLTQEMIDGWCEQRETESARSCGTRTQIARQFTEYARERGLTQAETPRVPKPEKACYVPYAFTHEELRRFFDECDAIVPYKNRRQSVIRKLQCPAFFRLLYSSGIRTTEARLLRREDVDLEYGVLDIQKSKGCDQHYVALHETMTEVLRAYDLAAEKAQPGREYFFESSRGGHLSRDWVEDNFTMLWEKANGSAGPVVAYDLRHNYAIENIGSWEDDCFEATEKLLYLSKSMGHRWTASTLRYYAIVPRLAAKIQAKTEEGFNAIVPEVWDAQE